MSIAERPTSDATPLTTAAISPAAVEVAGHHLTLYEGSEPLISAMVADVRRARRRVWLESYTIAADAAGWAVAEALIDRAAAGLDVRVMYDAIGSLDTPDSFFDRLVAAGVKVQAFRSIRDNLWRFKVLRLLNRRNHRKLLVIDDHLAYFGGMNIIDQRRVATPADEAALHLPASAGWRDLHVRLDGPQQSEIADTCDRLWQWARRGQRGQMRRVKSVPNHTAWRIREMLAASGDGLFFFAPRPVRRNRRIARILVPLIRGAQREITLSMAYFIPVGRVLRELVRARRRGVKVRVVIPGDSDVKAVQWATRHFCRYLLARGIQIFERQDEMLHSKAMVIDDEWSVVGSANLDPRSLLLNLEFVAAIRSRAMAAAVRQFCDHEIARSRRVRLTEIRARPWYHRLRDRLAWSLRRWL